MGSGRVVRPMEMGRQIQHQLISIFVAASFLPVLLLLYVSRVLLRSSEGGGLTAAELNAVDSLLVASLVLATAGFVLMHKTTNRVLDMIYSLRRAIDPGNGHTHNNLELLSSAARRLRQKGGLQEGEVLSLKDEIKVLEEELEDVRKQLGIHAPMPRITGRWNAHGWESYLAQEIERSRRYKKEFSVLFMELSNYSEITRSLPKRESEYIGRVVSEKAGELIRSSDLIAGYPDQYLVLLLPEAGSESCMKVAHRMAASLTQESFESLSGGSLHFKVRIGYASYPFDAMDAGTLVERARAALAYVAKKRDGIPVAAYNSKLMEYTPFTDT